MAILGAGMAATVALAGCGSESGSADGGSSDGTAAGTESAALPAELQADLQTVLDEARVEWGFPGAQVGVWTPAGAWIGTTGTAAMDDDRPITRDDHTRIGSITKTLTVTAMLQLIEQGKLSFEDTIGEYVPGMPNGDSATLRNLADMTSGIPPYTTEAACTTRYFDAPTEPWLPQELVDCVKDAEPVFPAGTQMQYSNSNLVLLGMVIEKVTGQSMEEVLRAGILDPLGMAQTSSPGQDADIPQPHLSGVTTQGNPDDAVKDATTWTPTFAFTAGDMISTLEDLHTWGVALATGEGILTPEMQKVRLDSLDTDVPPNAPDRSYGIGITRTDGWIGHTGEIPGFNTVLEHNPELDTTVVVMVNSDIGVDNVGPASLIYQQIVPILTGES